MRVLIAGGSGQIGSALIESVPTGYEIVAPDSASLDVSNSDSISRALRSFRPDLLINASGYTTVDKAESDRERAYAVNAHGVGNLAVACQAQQTRLIHLSTDYVFDGSKTSAYTEGDTPNPLNVYGASKLEGERLIAEANPVYLIVRVPWVFSAIRTNFVRTMLRLAPQGNLRVVDDQVGTPCAAEDIAATLWRGANVLQTMSEGCLLHYASTPTTTWHGFAKAIFETALSLGVVNKVPRVEPILSKDYPTPARRPANSLMDSSRLQRLLGVEPPDWRKALGNVLAELGRSG